MCSCGLGRLWYMGSFWGNVLQHLFPYLLPGTDVALWLTTWHSRYTENTVKFPANTSRQQYHHSRRTGWTWAKAPSYTTIPGPVFLYFFLHSNLNHFLTGQKAFINILEFIPIAWWTAYGSVLADWCPCHWRESSRGQECERMSLCLWMAWSKSTGRPLTRTSIQPL